jgi:hypothetical protein
MADSKISELTALTVPADGDLYPMVDVSDTTMAASGTTKQITHANLMAGTQRVFNVRQFGATGDGTTDDYAAVMAAINACHAAGGGTVYFPIGHYRIAAGPIIPPYDELAGAQKPFSWGYPIRFQGETPTVKFQYFNVSNPAWWPTDLCSVLDLQCVDDVAKVQCLGNTPLEIDHLVFTDSVDGTTPFFLITHTALHFHNNVVFGHALADWAQDCFVIGGADPPGPAEDPDDELHEMWAQTWTTIDNCKFHRLRRIIHFRTYANAVTFIANMVHPDCGGDAAFLATGDSQGAGWPVANNIISNQIETTGYVYGVDLQCAEGWSIVGNGFWDTGPNTLANVRFGNATKNNFFAGAYNGAAPPFIDNSWYAATHPNLKLVGHGLSGANYHAISGAASSAALSGGTISAGTIAWYMPDRGAAYKRLVLRLTGATIAAGSYITFPVEFTQAPMVRTGAADGGELTATISTLASLLYIACTNQTGFVIVEGF